MNQLNIFDTKPDTLDGYKAFWELYPRDKDRPQRKSGGSPKLGRDGKCQKLWIKHKMYKHKAMVMASLREDIAGIAKGAYAFCPGSSDRMAYFPMITTWMNSMEWARDAAPEPPKPVPVPVAMEDNWQPMTPEEKADMLPTCRLVAKRKASFWPRR